MKHFLSDEAHISLPLLSGVGDRHSLRVEVNRLPAGPGCSKAG